MKKVLLMAAMAFVAITGVNAQTTQELIKMQKEQNNAYRKVANEKTTKDAKKEAKKLEKEGWLVPAGRQSIEKQVSATQILALELMADANGNPQTRYIVQMGISTGGTFNAALGSARSSAIVNLASDLKTRVAAAMEQNMDNEQSTAITANTIEKFHQRSKMIVDACLTNLKTPMVVYRKTKQNMYEVQVQAAFDKQEIKERMKNRMAKELEIEGDELNDIVDQTLSGY